MFEEGQVLGTPMFLVKAYLPVNESFGEYSVQYASFQTRVMQKMFFINIEPLKLVTYKITYGTLRLQNPLCLS